MPHSTELIATLAVGLTAAFIGGLLAVRLRLPPIAGYLLAGMAVGPFTPGFVADAGLAPQLAEVGVILLMFGVGIHFSINDLLSVRKIALPGAFLHVVVVTALGIGLTSIWGWSLGAGIVFGLSLSVASTVVLLRALESRGQLNAEPGRVTVGWLVVEDLIMVLALVLLPVLAPVLGGAGGSVPANTSDLLLTIGLTLGKVAIFVAIMLIAGVRLVPWILGRVEGTQSRELFILATLTIALGIAYGASELFGVSFALGAFLAGVVVNESELSHRAAEEALPLRDAFAVLFFVSVGMLIDPAFLLDDVARLLSTLAIVIGAKVLIKIVLARMLGAGNETVVTVAIGLAQIGEFSFIFATMGIALGLLPVEGNNLILAVALFSIILNPFLFRLADWLTARRREQTPDIVVGATD